MPLALERHLRQSARRMAAKGELRGQRKGKRWDNAIEHMVYGTMTNMQKAGKIAPWRKLKHSKSM